MIDRLKVFTFMHRAEIEEYAKKVEDEPFRREAQKRLAWEVTSLVHGPEATQAAIDASEALFGSGELAALDAGTVDAVFAELGGAEAASGSNIVDVLVAAGISKSKSEARRSLGEGAINVNNVKVTDPEATFETGEGLGSGSGAEDVLILRRGRRTLAAVRLV